jgi:hypothetical protein
VFEAVINTKTGIGKYEANVGMGLKEEKQANMTRRRVRLATISKAGKKIYIFLKT